VDKTLEQYYKYMDNFQDDGAISSKKNKPAKPKSTQLTEELDYVKKDEAEMEMSEVKPK
jgi:hypothetical protein